jgi:hypothetical protein
MVAFLFSAIRELSIQHSAFSQSKLLSKSPAGVADATKSQTFFHHRQECQCHSKQLALSHWQLAFVFWLRPD